MRLGLPLLLAVTGPSSWRALFRTRRPGLQFVRALAPLVVGGSMVIGVHHLPLAEASVILFAGPFLVVALSGYVLGERVRSASWIGVAGGFLAVLMVARPGLGGLSAYAVFPLIAAIFYALFQLLTRQLAAAGEEADTTLAWTLAVGTVIAAPIALVEWVPLDAHGWLLAAALGLVYAVAQLMMVRAFVYAPANILTPFSYAQIISAALFGLLVFGDVPDGWTLLGIAMIIAAGAYVVRSTAKPEGGRSAAAPPAPAG